MIKTLVTGSEAGISPDEQIDITSPPKVEDETGIEVEEFLSDSESSNDAQARNLFDPSKIRVLAKTLTIFQVMRKIKYNVYHGFQVNELDVPTSPIRQMRQKGLLV